MDILFLSPHSDPQAKLGEPDSGGQCVYEHELATALSQIDNVNITVFCRRKFDHPALSVVNPHYKIQRITCGGTHFIRKEDIESVLPEFVDQILAEYPLTEETIVHAHYWDGAKAALMLKYRSGINFPISWTPHSLGIVKRQSFRGRSHEARYNFIPRTTWEHYIVQLADSLLVSSESEHQLLIERYYANPDHISIIPPGVNTSIFYSMDPCESRQFLELPQHDRLIVTAGRLTPEKGFHHTIHTLAQFNQDERQHMKLVIIGGSSNALSDSESAYLATLEALANKLGVSDSVIFRRAVDHNHMSAVYSAGDVFLCLSEYEPFGLTVIESMCVGTPVIATSNGGPADIVTHGYDGYLVETTHYSTIARHIKNLIHHPGEARQIAEHARQTVEQRFKWEVKARDCILNYNHLLQNRSADTMTFIHDSVFLKHNL